MSAVVLQSGLASATVLPESGALISQLTLVDRASKAQPILWLPDGFSINDPNAWPGGGLPFLFPFAGRVWHGQEVLKYASSGQVYDMPLHGFSWSKPWTVSAKGPNSVKLTLKSDDESKKKHYPFDFEIVMTITLSTRALHIAVDVIHTTLAAKTREKMPVALGWHPYFKLAKKALATIPADTSYAVTPVGNAGASDSVRDSLGPSSWTLPNPKLASLIFGDLNGEASRLDLGQHAITISAGPEDVMQHVVTWTNLPDEFFCIEPWMSLPDAVARSTGCRWLKPGERVSAWMSVECQ